MSDPLLALGSGFLRPLRSVLRTSLHAPLHADRVQRPADHVIPDAGQILDAAATNQHERMLLEVMTDARDVGRDLDPVGQTNPRHLAERRIRLLGRLGEYTNADAALLRTVLERRTLRLADDLLPA